MVLLVISKRFKSLKPDCPHLKDFSMLINLLFYKKLFGYREVEIFQEKHVPNFFDLSF